MEVQNNILKAGRTDIPSSLDDDIWVAAFRTAAILVMTDRVSLEFQSQYHAIISGTYCHALLDRSDAAEFASNLRQLAVARIYPERSTLMLELMGRGVIGDLMEVFWEGAREMPDKGEPRSFGFAGKAAALISRNYRQVFQSSLANKRGIPEVYYRYQLVTDYVCGMTDSFAKRLHADLFNGR